MNVVNARLLASRSDVDLGRGIAPASCQPVPRYRLYEGAVCALDTMLSTTATRPVPVSPYAQLLAATPDLRQVVIVDDGHLVVLSESTTRLPLPDADTATFIAPGQLLVTTPDLTTTTTSSWGGHRALLIEAGRGDIFDDVVLPEASDAGACAYPHPADGAVLLDLGEGQDGSRLFAVRAVGKRLTVEYLMDDVVCGGFSPDGARLLILPHPSFPRRPFTLAWPGLEPVGTASPADADIGDESFDLYGCYLSDDRVLLKTYDRGLLLGSRDMDILTPLGLPWMPPPGGEDVEISSLCGLSSSRFAAGVWHNGTRTTTLWQLPP